MMSTADFRQAGHSDGAPRIESSQIPRSIMCAIPADGILSFNPNADTLSQPLGFIRNKAFRGEKLSLFCAITRDMPQLAWSK